MTCTLKYSDLSQVVADLTLVVVVGLVVVFLLVSRPPWLFALCAVVVLILGLSGYIALRVLAELRGSNLM